MKSIYQDVLNRALNTLFHPSVQWHRVLKTGYQVPRYPSPASESVDHHEHDFKTSYRDSMYNVRNDEFEKKEVMQFFIADPLFETQIQKLIRLRYITRDQQNNEEVVNTAKAAYQTYHGESVEQKIQRNDFQDKHYNDIVSGSNKREALGSLIRDQFESLRDNVEDVIQTNLDDDYHQEFNDKVDHNLNGNDPVFRQLIVDLHTVLARFGQRKQQLGYDRFFKGDPQFWQSLDNSFQPQQIAQVQTAIKDPQVGMQCNLKQTQLPQSSNTCLTNIILRLMSPYLINRSSLNDPQQKNTIQNHSQYMGVCHSQNKPKKPILPEPLKIKSAPSSPNIRKNGSRNTTGLLNSARNTPLNSVYEINSPRHHVQFSQLLMKLQTKSFSSMYTLSEFTNTKNPLFKIIQNDVTGILHHVFVLSRSEPNADAMIQSLEEKYITHSNIVQVYNIFADELSYYIIIEKVSGIKLSKYIKKLIQPLSVELLMTYFLQIIDSINHLHQHDLHYQNLTLSSFKLYSESNTQFIKLTKIQNIYLDQKRKANAAQYLPPEHQNNNKCVKDSSQDIWICGFMLLHLYKRQYPYKPCKALEQMIERIQEEPLNIQSQVSEEIKQILLPMIQIDHSKRIPLKQIFVKHKHQLITNIGLLSFRQVSKSITFLQQCFIIFIFHQFYQEYLHELYYLFITQPLFCENKISLTQLSELLTQAHWEQEQIQHQLKNIEEAYPDNFDFNAFVAYLGDRRMITNHILLKTFQLLQNDNKRIVVQKLKTTFKISNSTLNEDMKYFRKPGAKFVSIKEMDFIKYMQDIR